MGTRHLLKAGVAALALSAMAVSAQAGGSSTTLSAAQQGLVALSELSVLSLGNATSSSDIEGKVFVGGNASLSEVDIGTGNNPGQGYVDSTLPILTVYGNASGSLDIKNGANGSIKSGTAYPDVTIGGDMSDIGGLPSGYTLEVGGTIGSSLNPSKNDTITTGGNKPAASNINGASATFDVPGYETTLQSQIAAQTTAFKTDLTALSKELVKLNGGVSTSGDSVAIGGSNQDLIVSALKDSGYAVIDIDASVLESAGAKSLEFDLKSTALPVIINVINNTKSTSITVAPNLATETQGPDVLWNFGTSFTKVSLPSGFSGSVLAPDANVSTGNQLNGSLAAASVSLNGEVHLGTFVGDAALSHAVSGVPEPSTWAVMILGVGLVGSALRRRRAMVPATHA